MNEMRDYDNRDYRYDNRYYDENIHGNMGYRENYRDDYREDYRDDYRSYRDYDYRRDYDRRGGKINNRYRNYRNYRGGDYYEELEMIMGDMKETSRKIEDVADMASNQQDKHMLMKIAQKEKENHSYIKSLVEK